MQRVHPVVYAFFMFRRLISQAQALKFKSLRNSSGSSSTAPLSTFSSSLSEMGVNASSVEYVKALRRLVLKHIKLQFVANDSSAARKPRHDRTSTAQVAELALRNGGFVSIGEVKYGCSRHMGILFKVTMNLWFQYMKI